MSSPFTRILQRLVQSVPGATAAIFADWEGEAVGEYAPGVPQIEIRIVGAQWGVVWSEVQRSFERASLGEPAELIFDGERGAALIRRVTRQYYVVLLIERGGHLAKALSELSRGADELSAEM